jgi:hypothetical protein
MKRPFIFVLALLAASPLFAQNTANQTELRLVIVDQTGAGIPAATVIITPQTGGAAVTFESDARGMATSPALTPGQVTVHVEFPGFEPFDAPLTLRRGPMNETVTLKIEGFKEEVAVTQESAPEASKSTSTTTLTQEEIDALPDDPDELADALSALAGPGGATFFMNGFSGGRLPNRDQIRSIRFRQNNYAADNHDAGRTQIEIITRPNTNWGGNLNANFGGDSLNARQPQQPTETPSQERTVQLGVRGPVVPGRTSFNFNANGNARYNSNPLSAIDQFGNPINESARATNDQKGFQIGIEHSLTANQGMLINFQRSDTEQLNQGVGGFNLPERASTRLNDSNQLRFRLQGVMGTTMLNELRLQVIRQSNEAFSVSPAPTVVVQEAFTSGGAGVNSNSSTNRLELAENFDFNVGTRHQMRVGLLVEGAWFSNFDERNKAGTFTYRTIDDYNAGFLQQYTQRLGTLDTSFSQFQGGIYWSDEFRMHRDLTLGVGVRNELQSRIDSKINLMPRLGFTWAPFGSQRSAIRGGYGLFYDWYESSLYDQTLRVDGVTVRDVRINCAPLDPFTVVNLCDDLDAIMANPPATLSGRIQASPDLDMPRVHQASISYDRQIGTMVQLQTSYQMLRGRHQMRSRNINVRVDGFRPNPSFGDITQFESTGRTESDRLNVGVRFRLPFQFQQGQQQQQPVMFNVNYTLGQEKNFADGSTSLPSDNNNPDVDWGPSRNDIRHRVQFQAQGPLVFGIRANVNLNVNGGAPYNMTTGRDDNNDGAFNDRPFGVTRNALRGDSTWGLNLNLNRRFFIGGLRTPATPANALGGALFQRGGGGGFGGPGGQGGNNRGQGGNANSRYSMEVFAQATNVLNHVTRTGYVGNLSSPLFGTPVNYGQPRDINVGLRFNF